MKMRCAHWAISIAWLGLVVTACQGGDTGTEEAVTSNGGPGSDDGGGEGNDDGDDDDGDDDDGDDDDGDDDDGDDDDGDDDDGDDDDGDDDDGDDDDGDDDDGDDDDGDDDDGDDDDGGDPDSHGDPANCDDFSDPGYGDDAAVGGPVPWLKTVNQYGDDVVLCQYAKKPILVDFSTGWCNPCKEYARILAGLSEPGSSPAMQAAGKLKGPVEAGEIRWITVLTQSSSGQPAALVDLEAWHDEFPNPHVPVIADDAQQLYGHATVQTAYPSFALIDVDFRWEALDHSDELIENPIWVAGEKYGD